MAQRKKRSGRDPQGSAVPGETQQHETVRKLVRFQDTGEGFDGLWNDLAPIVEEFARRSLRTALFKGGAKSAFRDVEEATGEVVNDTVLRLNRLADPGAGGRFDPSRAKPGLSGLRGWLWQVVKSQAVNWVRDFRGGRSVKIWVESGLVGSSALGLNEPVTGDEGGAFLDRQVAKLEREDLLPVLEACIARLSDPLMREMVLLKLHEELSVRDTADELQVTESKVQRRLTAAYALLRPMLEARGMDASWLAA